MTCVPKTFSHMLQEATKHVLAGHHKTPPVWTSNGTQTHIVSPRLKVSHCRPSLIARRPWKPSTKCHQSKDIIMIVGGNGRGGHALKTFAIAQDKEMFGAKMGPIVSV